VDLADALGLLGGCSRDLADDVGHALHRADDFGHGLAGIGDELTLAVRALGARTLLKLQV
jgi:hypothetical protein